MSAQIHIGSVKIPVLDYAVSCNAILGIRDSGKTVTAKGIAEQLIEHSVPIMVFDAVGKWRWMKVPGPKNGKAYKVVVAGGRAPDLPLTMHSVAQIVRSAMKERIPLIIDLYDPKLSKADWRSIVQQAIRIVHYEAENPIHVFLEEAAEYVPQRVQDGATYAEVEKLARMGGNASVGITLINQRSQEVNKAVLDLSHNLILGCQIGNKAIEAVEKWVDRLAPETAKEVTHSLPKLKSGEAWVWTRSSPDEPSREQLPMCRSLHPDRRTPEVVLKSAKPVDISEFVSSLSALIPKVIEEAKANDPAELKREIARLKKELAAKPESKPAEPIPIPILPPQEKKVLVDTLEDVRDSLEDVQTIFQRILKIYPEQVKASTYVPPSKSYPISTPTVKPSGFQKDFVNPPSNGKLAGGMRRMMIALAQRPGGLNKKQLGVRAGLSSKSGTFGTYLSSLRSAGHIVEEGDRIALTQHGLESLGSYEKLPEGAALFSYWAGQLGGKQSEMLRVIAHYYPQTVSAGEVAEKINMAESGTFGTYLSKLRSLELVTGTRNALKASDELFD